MYASITYSTSSATNLADVVSDIVALMTGETNKANLSSHVVQAGTEIISTVAAGWTVEETLSPTDRVLKAPISDDPTKFKYIRITGVNLNTSYPAVLWEGYSTWDVSTSTGTVVTRNFDNGNHTYPSSTSTIYKNYIYYNLPTQNDQTQVLLNVSPNHIMSQCRYGNSYANQMGPAILCEHTRNDAWDTVANGFPPFVVSKLGFSDVTFASASYTYNWMWVKPSVPNSSGTTTSNLYAGTLTPYGHSSHPSVAFTAGVKYTDMIDENLNTVPALIPFGCVNYLNHFQGGDMSAKSGMYMANLPDPGITGDVFVHNGENYRIQRLCSGRQGGGSASGTLVFLCKEA